MTRPVILVTGGAGYIGSHAVRALQQAGHTPVVLDNLAYGHRRIVDDVLSVPLVVGQVGDRALLDQLLSGQHPATDGFTHPGGAALRCVCLCRRKHDRSFQVLPQQFGRFAHIAGSSES